MHSNIQDIVQKQNLKSAYQSQSLPPFFTVKYLDHLPYQCASIVTHTEDCPPKQEDKFIWITVLKVGVHDAHFMVARKNKKDPTVP